MTMTDQDDSPQQPDRSRTQDGRTGRSAAAARMAHQHTWVDQQIRIAMEKGEFDDLPGAGKPIKGLGASHDPDWWLKKLVERERIAVLPPSLQLRKDDAELDDRLDELFAEPEVRREVEDFNARVMRARYSPQDGQPPLVTMPRDVDETVAAWQRRRADRRTARAAAAAAAAESPAPPPPRRRGRLWRRRRP
jgi:hypothetical protein